MALDWDNIVIKTDEYSYSLDSEQRMIIFEGQPGAMGPSGGITIGSVETLPAGSSATVTNTGTFSSAILNFGIPKGDPGDYSAVWGAIGGTLSDQTDLDNALASKADTADLGDMASIDDAPSDGEQYARKNGTWEQVQASSTPAWGDISGTLSNQTDLSNALASKANTADLGDMATVDDAPSDNKNYARKNGTWSEVTGGGGGGGSSAWGDITGTLSDQTDLQSALNLKTDLAIQAWPLPAQSSQISEGNIYYDANNNRFQATIGNVTTAGPLADVIYFLLSRKANTDGFAPTLPTSGTIDDGLYYDASKAKYVLYRDGSESANYTLESLLQAVERMKIDDAPSDGAQYARKDGQWTVVTGGGGGGSASWGGIVGTLSNQSDLQAELDGKAPVIKGYLPQQASGTTVTVPSDSDFADIKIKLDVSQSGTGDPSSENIRPFLSENQVVLKIGSYYDGEIGSYYQIAVNLPISLYAGIIDLKRGIVTVTHEHIQSYNGETIPGIWYSDRDIYRDGRTPSTGAEVVYELAVPFQVSIDKEIIPNPKQGDSTVLSILPDSGMNRTISLVYLRGDSQTVVDTKGYVDAKEASLGLMAYADDAPTDNSEYVRKNGGWAISTGGGGGGTPVWGNITGTLSNQTDLNTALNAKANSADLGDLASEDDAPSDNTQYARKNGAWDQIATPAWGAISGTLANQTDLQTALNAKQGTLTFDSTPTFNSDNPVTSDGIAFAIDMKQDALQYDGVPTAYSTNVMTSGAIKNALDTLDDAKVSKSGDTITGTIYLNNTNMFFKKDGVNSGQIFSSGGNQITLRNYLEGSGYSELFYTPTPNSNLTENKSYNILTTKNVVTTAQGGTGGTDSGWLTLSNSSTFTGSVNYRKIGEWVFVTTHGAIRNVSEITTADLALFTIPSGFRPKYNFATTIKTNTNGLMVDAFITAASGQLSIRARIGSTIPANTYIYMSFMYFV